MARTTAEEQATEGAETGPAEDETPVEEDTTSAEDPAVEDAASEEHADTDEPADEAPSDRPRRRLPRIADPVLLIATVLVVVAGACAAYFGWSWYRAAHDDALAYSRARDAVLHAGSRAYRT